MQQLPGPNAVAAPTFWQAVLGSMIGIFGCFLVTLLVSACLFVVFFAVLGPQIGNVFSRITSGLGVP
jgi:hypothetical protein